MTDNNYEDNGDYSNYTEDDDYSKQRKTSVGPGLGASHNGDGTAHGLNMSTIENNHLSDKANEYIRDCLSEKARLERKFPIAEKLLDNEIEKVQTTGRIPTREQKYADIYREKPLRISQKVLVPIREHPKFNFVGKLLGPKGNSLRRLQEETLCKMTVLGRNSMRDRAKEEELRNSKEPKYAHLNSDLHVEISTVAPPAEAFARLAYAMAELRKYLIPDSNDIIRQEQLRELMDNVQISENNKTPGSCKKLLAHQTSGIINAGLGLSQSGSTGGAYRNNTNHQQQQQQQQQSSTSTFNKNNLAPKEKVMSILEKARTAMEETYGRGFEADNINYEHNVHNYGLYSYGNSAPLPLPHNTLHTTHSVTGGIGDGVLNTRAPYDSADYPDIDYTRRDYYQPSPGYGTSGSQSKQNNILNPNHNSNRGGHVNR